MPKVSGRFAYAGYLPPSTVIKFIPRPCCPEGYVTCARGALFGTKLEVDSVNDQGDLAVVLLAADASLMVSVIKTLGQWRCE